MSREKAVSSHYGVNDLTGKILSGLARLGKEPTKLAIEDLAPVDAFHMRGRISTTELSEFARLQPGQRVLDVGSGLGGSCRFLADRFGCSVTGIDLTTEYVETARQLTALVGLDSRIHFEQGSALDLPFPDDSFDLVWTEHVQMNIDDKHQFYCEVARVLKPGGSFLCHDVFGNNSELEFPVPWAQTSEMSCLVSSSAARQYVADAGLVVEKWEEKVDESIGFFEQTLAHIQAQGPPPLGIHLLMGDSARSKLENCLAGLRQGAITPVIGVARKPAA